MADLGGIISSPHNTTVSHAANTDEQTLLILTGRTIRSELNVDISAWTTPKIIRVRNSETNDVASSHVVLQKRWASDMTSDFDTGVASIPLIIDSGYPFKFVTVQSEEAETASIQIPVFWIEVQQ